MIVELYGHRVELAEPVNGVVTDVVVLAREVIAFADGRMADAVLLSATAQTTGIVVAGLLVTAEELADEERP